ncbi:MAG: YdeI/OmpD-associated family protein [Pseudomonadota bacterium]
MAIPDLPHLQIEKPEELWVWLEGHHGQDSSVLLVTFKKHVADRYVSTGAVLDALVAFDWMDGRRFKLDADRTMQLISPRKAQHWSKTYKDRAARLIADGRMHDAGLKGIERAKANGGWTFLDDVDALVVPDDLETALKSAPTAWAHYQAFPPSAQRDILRWIKLAKTAATRSKRIAETVAKAARNERASGTR